MTKHQKKSLVKIFASAICLILAAILNKLLPTIPWYLSLISYLPAYLLVGGEVLVRAGKNILRGQVFDENFLMALATVGAFLIQQYPEAVAVMLFYQVGEFFQDYAVNRSRKSIAELMDIRPDYANVRIDGKLVRVNPDEVNVGDEIEVTAGERIPLDGVVVSGTSSIDTKALTGESVPRTVGAGDEILSGCINLSGVLTIKVSKPFGESTVSKILELVENATSKKAPVENFITKFARYYTPIVVIAAVILAIVPPLLIPGQTWQKCIEQAINFLVVSCPCALVISVPLSFFGGIGAASKAGILIKGSSYMETLTKTEIVVFDKTGTLTRGVFEVTQIAPHGTLAPEELIQTAALVENYSNHPISQSLQSAYGKEIDESRIKDFQEIAGHGVRAIIDGNTVLAGNTRLMDQEGISYVAPTQPGTIVHIATNNIYQGYIVIADEIKPDSPTAIQQLKKQGIKTVMLTGDSKAVGEAVAKDLGLDEVHTQLLPGDKVSEMEKLMESKSPKGKLAFVGDGINDAPVLAQADIGIAMGGLGSDAAIETADIVLMDDEPSKIPVVMDIAKYTLRIVVQNIVFALGVKALVLILTLFDLSNIWTAVFSDVGVSVLAILNSMRVLGYKGYRKK